MMEGAATAQRQGYAYVFAQYLLGDLDFADDPFRYTFLEVPLGEASSHFMSMYFGKLDRYSQSIVDASRPRGRMKIFAYL
jgi:hypothetical protein